MPVDPRAVSGFVAADAYAQGRPSYPSEAIDRIMDFCQLTVASTVIDLAAGTGQVSRLLHGRVGHVIAVEPSLPMRAKLVEEAGDVTAVEGVAEAIPLADATADAVVVGEAFHWFQPIPATVEIARVLTGRGGLALLWNTPTWTIESTVWLDAVRQVLAPYKRAAGSYPAAGGAWRDHLESSGLFEPLLYSEFRQVQTLKPSIFLAQVASWSWIANLQPSQREGVLRDVETVVREYDELVIPYRTDLYLARRRTVSPTGENGDAR